MYCLLVELTISFVRSSWAFVNLKPPGFGMLCRLGRSQFASDLC